MPIAMPNLTAVMPEVVMTCVAIIMLMAELVIKRKETLGFLTILSVGLISYLLLGSAGTTFGGMFVSDGYSTFFKLIFMTNLVITILISPKYLQTMRINFGEYYALALFATLGMMIMARI